MPAGYTAACRSSRLPAELSEIVARTVTEVQSKPGVKLLPKGIRVL